MLHYFFDGFFVLKMYKTKSFMIATSLITTEIHSYHGAVKRKKFPQIALSGNPVQASNPQPSRIKFHPFFSGFGGAVQHTKTVPLSLIKGNL
jgi:hypothetical protein